MEQCEKRPQLLKMRKKNQIKHKKKCVTDFLLTVSSSSMKNYSFHYVVITYKQIVYINFNKINVNLEIFFTRNRVLTHKEVVSNQNVSCNGLGKM